MTINEQDLVNGRYIGEGLGAPEAQINLPSAPRLQIEAMGPAQDLQTPQDLKRMELLYQGINLSLYNSDIVAINSRVTVCNGLFLEWENNDQRSGVKVRVNASSPYYLVNRDNVCLLLIR